MMDTTPLGADAPPPTEAEREEGRKAVEKLKAAGKKAQPNLPLLKATLKRFIERMNERILTLRSTDVYSELLFAELFKAVTARSMCKRFLRGLEGEGMTLDLEFQMGPRSYAYRGEKFERELNAKEDKPKGSPRPGEKLLADLDAQEPKVALEEKDLPF